MALDSISILESVLTHAEPLGPIDQTRIVDDVAKRLLYEDVAPFEDIGNKPYMLLLGRKGAGKSAILADTRLKHPGVRAMPVPEHLPKEGEAYIIPVMSWQHFHQITLNVSRQYPANDVLADIVPPERYVSLWYEMLWDEIIQHFFNYTHFPEVGAFLAPVDEYINANTCFQGSAEKEARKRFDAAKRSVLEFLELRNSRLYYLFDSMENYPVRHIIFSRVLTGFFQALGSINCESQYIHISFCIPEELEGFLSSNSANLLKDFASSYRIRWTPIDLLRIVAHRFRLAMEVYDKDFHKELRSLDFSRREHINKLFRGILPLSVKNRLGEPEDPLAYIIRHTQLLPRHVLAIFNAILSRNYQSTGGFRKVNESSIQDGVTHVEQILAQQVLYPYERLYPRLIAACRQILPDLDPICSFTDLKKVEARFKQRIEEDIASIWDTLFQIGVIGRVVKPSADEGSASGQSGRYCYGHFHFNADGAFGMATDSEYCFHPVFSKAFGVFRRSPDKRTVYPANVEMVTLT